MRGKVSENEKSISVSSCEGCGELCKSGTLLDDDVASRITSIFNREARLRRAEGKAANESTKVLFYFFFMS